MIVETNKSVEWLIETFLDQNLEIYIVGGAVRDLLMGRQVGDWDFTTNATPEVIIQLFKETFYDNSFGTVGVVNHEEKQRYDEGIISYLPIYEVTTFRTEHGYSDGRRPDKVEWGASLEEDLERRDFTISAMALKPVRINNGFDYELIDLHGGKKDLDNKLIRTVGDARARFSEDALRMMRAIRIGAQLGFAIEEQTLIAINELKETISRVSVERIREEIFKIMVSNYPGEGIKLLFTCGLIEYILPELVEGRNVQQGGHHTDDVWNHAIKSLDACPSNDAVVKFATLIHDIGKPRSRAFVCEKCSYYWRPVSTIKEINEMEILICPRCAHANAYLDSVVFHNHEMIGADMAREICTRLKMSNTDTERIVNLVRWHMFSVDERQTDKAIRRFIRNVGKENLEDMINLRIGDRIGGGARETSWRLERFKDLLIKVQEQPFSIKDLKIDGNEIMELLSIPPGKKVGQILNRLFDEVDEEKIKNEKEELIKRTMELNDEIN